MRTRSGVRLKPPRPIALGDYELDAFVVELGEGEASLDFRFELGQGLGIYWALPAGRRAPLRLLHVDGAAYHVDEPILVASPWRCDVPRMAWEGELGRLEDGRRLIAVQVEATALPASYRCELVTVGDEGDERTIVLDWAENAAARIVAGPVLGGHRTWIVGAAFSPDGDRIVSGDSAGELVLWGRDSADPATGFVERTRARATSHDGTRPGQICGVAWSPTGDLVATHERHGVRARRGSDLSEVAFAPYVGRGPIAFGGGGAWLAALGQGSATILEAPSLAHLDVVAVRRGSYEYFDTTALATDPGGPWVAVADDGGSDETAMGMRLDSGVPQVTVQRIGEGRTSVAIAQGDHASALAFDPWRGEIVVASFGGKLACWMVDGTCRRALYPYGETAVRALAITEHVLALAPGHPPGAATLDLWDATTLQRLASTPIPGGIAPDWIAASPDGRLLVTPVRPDGHDFGLRVWTIET